MATAAKHFLWGLPVSKQQEIVNVYLNLYEFMPSNTENVQLGLMVGFSQRVNETIQSIDSYCVWYMTQNQVWSRTAYVLSAASV